MVTSLAVRQLVEAGQIELEAPVQRYLPWFTLADPDPAAQITLANLLDYTSGLSTFDGQDPRLYREGLSIEDVVRGLAGISPNRPVGVGYEYSNVNYVTLGMVVQAVSGQSYEDDVREHIYAPLGMDCTFSQARPRPTAWRPAIASGSGPDRKREPQATGMLPAGYHLCSAEGLADLAAAIANGGVYQGVSVITPGRRAARAPGLL